MTTVPIARQIFTYDDYRLLERNSNVRHEFLNGEVWAMAVGSSLHARIVANVVNLLHEGLAGQKCAVFSTDLCLRVPITGLATYPDIVVVHGQIETETADPQHHTVTNPRVIVEVLSPSTEVYDRGEKLAHYEQFPGLMEVVLVAHGFQMIEVVRRESPSTWSHRVATAGQIARLPSLGCGLAVDRVYDDLIDPA